MTRTEILDEINKRSTEERLEIIESALHTLRQELRQRHQVSTKQQLAEAAQALVADYSDDEELTALTALDSEDFRE